ncbi:MAG: hypothetical protein ABIP94_03540 [Planctomycetota bacterium]
MIRSPNIGVAAWLVLAFEDHDRADLGHAGRVAALAAPHVLDHLLDGRDRTRRFAADDHAPHLAVLLQVDAHLLGGLAHAQRVGRCGADDGDAHLDDLLDALFGRHVAGRQREAAHLLAAVVSAPEADERAVREREEHRVGRTDAEAPEAVAPHVSDPRPVLARIEHAQRLATRGARRQVVADGLARRPRDQVAEQRLVGLGRHPVLARHERQAADVVECSDLVGLDARLLVEAAMERRLFVRPGDEVLQLAQLQCAQLILRQRFDLGIPERRFFGGHERAPEGRVVHAA